MARWAVGRDVAFQGLSCPLYHRKGQVCTVFEARRRNKGAEEPFGAPMAVP